MHFSWQTLVLTGFLIIPTQTRTTAVARDKKGFIACLSNITSHRQHSHFITARSPDYDEKRVGYNRAIASNYPLAIFYAGTSQDAAEAIKCAASHDVPVAPRSGGYSYEGYSSGTDESVVIDVSGIDHYRFIKGENIAVVGPGHKLGSLYDKLWKEGEHFIPAGTHPKLAVGGHLLSGGLGMASRSYGVGSSGIVNMTVVDAKGVIRHVNAKQDAELFWAMRGAGGGSFGLVTELYVRAYEAPSNVVIISLDFPGMQQYSKMMDSFGRWSALAERRLSARMILHSGGANVRVTYLGSRRDAWLQVNSFLATFKHDAAILHQVNESNWHEAAATSVGLYGGAFKEDGSMRDMIHFRGRSLLFRTPLNKRERAVIQKFMKKNKPEEAMACYIALDLWGGKLDEVVHHPSAFDNHRGVLFSMHYMVQWGASTSRPGQKCRACSEWSLGLKDALFEANPYRPVEHYQGYIEKDDENPLLMEMYGGSMIPLMRVKEKYDPSDIFSFPQSIPLP